MEPIILYWSDSRHRIDSYMKINLKKYNNLWLYAKDYFLLTIFQPLRIF